MTKQAELPTKYLNRYPNVQLFQDSGRKILRNANSSLPPSSEVFTQSWWQQHGQITGSAAGRGTTLFVRHETHDLILRQYLRGGLPGKILSNQFIFTGYENSRAWQEFFLLLDMQALGLPVPEPIMADVVRSGLIYRNRILIKRIPDAADLHHILTQQKLEDAIWLKLGKLVRRFHDQQIYHHDLNIRNILLDKQNNGWLIDFDKCAIKAEHHWKADNLARLKRSLLKEQARNSEFYWQESDWLYFLQGYQTITE